MNKRFTENDIIVTTRGEKNKNIIVPEYFEKELPARKKKPKTYFSELDDALKFFIDIDVDINLIASYSNLLERYVNTFPDLSHLINIFHTMFLSSMNLRDLLIRRKENFEHRSNESKKRFLNHIESSYEIEEKKYNIAVSKYMNYLIKYTNQKFTDTDSIKNYSKNHVLKQSEDFFKVYAHCNTFKEAFDIYEKIFNYYVTFDMALDLNGETITEMKIVKGYEKQKLKKETTKKLKNLLSFYTKEYKKLKEQFEKNLEVFYEKEK